MFVSRRTRRFGAFRNRGKLRRSRHAATGAAPNFPARQALRARVYDGIQPGRLADPAAEILRERGIREYCAVPLIVRERALGTLNVGSTEPGAFGSAAVAMVEAVARQVASPS